LTNFLRCYIKHDTKSFNETLKPLIEAPDYEEGKIENASKAAFGLSKWVKAMVQYDEAMKVVKPK
jgi:dynein heavy chain